MINELIDEITAKRNGKASSYIECFLEELFEDFDKEYISSLQKKYHCDIYMSVEKHSQLQKTYYFEITSDLIKGELHLEVESGISNGTCLNYYSFEDSFLPNSRTIEILKDIIFNEEKFYKWYLGTEENRNFVKRKAEIIFSNHKQELFKLHREQSYDNYVTGGGTNKTDSYYSNILNNLREKGVFWKYVYEEIEVDINLI